MTDSFDDVMARIAAGDEDAATEVFNRFAKRLIGLARTRLDSPEIRRKIDPEDVVQSAFLSFFVRQAEGRFQIDGWNSLWGLLAQITLRKSGRQIDSLQAACRDIRREVSPQAVARSEGDSWDVIVREPTPEEAIILTETVEILMGELSVTERHMLALRLQGHTIQEISEEVGNITERTVYRALAGARKRLERMRNEDD